MGMERRGGAIWALVLATGLAWGWIEPAAARTLDVLQQSGFVLHSDQGQGGGITGQVTRVVNGNLRTQSLYAGAFQLKARTSGTNDAYENFVAFCVEIGTSLTTGVSKVTTYEEAPDLFDTKRQALVATLYQEVWDPTGSLLHQGAFQLALWKITHGDVATSAGDGFDLTGSSAMQGGFLSFTTAANGKSIKDTFDKNTPGAFSMAQGWLDHLGNGSWSLSGKVSDHVTFLRNDNSQDLVTSAMGAAPAVPLPPAALLMAGAFGTLLWMIRRRA